MSPAYSPRLLCGWAKPACLFLLLTMHAAAWATQPAPAPVAVTSFSSLLQVLSSLNVNVIFGEAIDNSYDMNCDGFGDLVVG